MGIDIIKNWRISIHALREEGDLSLRLHPRRSKKNFYPRPPRGGQLLAMLDKIYHAVISIHALREEGDTLAATLAKTYKISIHALREEGDTINQLRQAFQVQFLSTPSARRATYNAIYTK